MTQENVYSVSYGGRDLTVRFGKLAAQADMAVTVQYGDTTVLATVMSSKQKRSADIDFLPLTVDYEERWYASGKISGSRFIKREGRPSESAILTSRLIDRPTRPLFPKGYFCDVQVMVMALSYDRINSIQIPALIGTSLALALSDIPWNGPISLAEVGIIDDQLVLNPTEEQKAVSILDLSVVSTHSRVNMIEAGAKQVPQSKVIEAISFAHEQNQAIVAFQNDIIARHGKTKRAFEYVVDLATYQEIEQNFGTHIKDLSKLTDKLERKHALEAMIATIKESYGEQPEKATQVSAVVDQIDQEYVRTSVLSGAPRIDGRMTNQVRPISGEVGILPRVHGSGLFNRGYTQILNVLTLGSLSQKQLLDTMEGETSRRYMHHYNFPPFSVGETKPLRSAGRREIGHGALAEKALAAVIPGEDVFPYTIRLVSEALSSDGSTSMGSTCASTLSLMDAGVPISAPVSGIAMGLVEGSDGQYKILTDIAGAEDHYGDMDFKITGTRDGITAIQLDVKNSGLTLDMIRDTFTDGETGRLHILSEMLKVIDKPRDDLSEFAPRVEIVMIHPDKIRDVIGPGGKMINKIIEETGVQIDIEQDGRVLITSPDLASIKKAKEIVLGITEDPEPGRIYDAKVVKIMDFGAFVAIGSGHEGLVHISEIADTRVEKVTDYLKEGQDVKVKLMQIDDLGRLNFSIKQAQS